MSESDDLETVVRLLNRFKDQVRRDYRARMVAVFGSYARREQRAHSDLDVLVDFGPEATLFDLVGLADFLEERLHRRIDVVPVDTLREEIKSQVLREAVPL